MGEKQFFPFFGGRKRREREEGTERKGGIRRARKGQKGEEGWGGREGGRKGERKVDFE